MSWRRSTADPGDERLTGRNPRGGLVPDSPVEQQGFELPVPLAKRVGLSGATGGAAEAKRAVPRASFILRGDRGFESSSLHRRVHCEPDSLDQGASGAGCTRFTAFVRIGSMRSELRTKCWSARAL
jgi:hypothetical protein